MKKTLLPLLAFFVFVGTALAVPSLGDRRAMCEKYSDKYVWVEKSEACVPSNPCVSDVASIRNTYCNNAFSDVSVRNYGVAEELVRRYMGAGFTVRKHPGSDRYIVATQTADDVLSTYDYLVFEFRDIGSNDQEDAFIGACLAYGGAYIDKGCFYLDVSCDDLGVFVSFVYGDDVELVPWPEGVSGCSLKN